MAAWWRLRGKRLRARSQCAPLLSLTPGAYRLWLTRQQPRPAPSSSGPPIVALIDAGSGAECTDTIASLARAGVDAQVVCGSSEKSLSAAFDQVPWNLQPWLMLLPAGDIVSADVADAYRSAVTGADAHIAYADDDLLDRSYQRHAPHFKPKWNAELFSHHDYLSGACIIRLDRAEAEAAATATDWIPALVRKALRRGTPLHVPHILHHRRIRPTPRTPSPLPILRDTLPKVSVIIPTRNRSDLLFTCLQGLKATSYPEVETIIVDNDSDEPNTIALLAESEKAGCTILRHPGPFNFSTINNRAVAAASGALLCLLNNDIEMINADWLATLATQATRSDVGAVGAQLLYPDGRIQHAGVVLGICEAAAHAHRFMMPEQPGYFARHALPQFVSAVTAACLVVARDRYLAVGGLDEVNFPVAFNDVDLCLRLNQRGWQSFYEPRAQLIHHESLSRGFDTDPVGAARFAGELSALKRLWSTEIEVDPYHHEQLSRFSEHFVVRL